jgi:HlyD family secretion protein
MRDRMMASREAPQAERQKAMERSRSEMRAQVAEMLTPEQKKKYEEIVAEQGGDRRSGAGGTTPGRIYVLDEKRQPKEIGVRLGLTDGTMTEVISPDVKEGMNVVTGMVQQGGGSRPATSSARRAGPRMF